MGCQSSQDISGLRLCCGKLKMDDGFVTFHPNGIHIDLGICKTWQDMQKTQLLPRGRVTPLGRQNIYLGCVKLK